MDIFMSGTVLHIGKVRLLFWNGEPVGLEDREGNEFYTYPVDSPMVSPGNTFGRSVSKHFGNPKKLTLNQFQSKMIASIIDEIYSESIEKAGIDGK